MKKTLTEIGIKHITDKATYHLFTDFYESEFTKCNFVPKDILEIGIFTGRSLLMWKEFFPDSNIEGIDIVFMAGVEKLMKENSIKIYLEDATKFVPDNKMYDLIIDDGSHLNSHQQKSFELYYPLVKEGGIYVIEDLHTSFMGFFKDTEVTTYDWLKSRTDLNFTIWENEHKGEWREYRSITSIIKKPKI